MSGLSAAALITRPSCDVTCWYGHACLLHAGGGGSWEQVLADFWAPFSGRLDEVAGEAGRASALRRAAGKQPSAAARLRAALPAPGCFGRSGPSLPLPCLCRCLRAAGVPVTEVIDRLNEVAGDSLIGSSRTCPSCGSPLSLKLGSRKQAPPFVGCSAYPSAWGRALGAAGNACRELRAHKHAPDTTPNLLSAPLPTVPQLARTPAQLRAGPSKPPPEIMKLRARKELQTPATPPPPSRQRRRRG